MKKASYSIFHVYGLSKWRYCSAYVKDVPSGRRQLGTTELDPIEEDIDMNIACIDSCKEKSKTHLSDS